MFDLITVVFEPELPLLEIQARSIDQNFEPEQISTIFVVVNDKDSVVTLVNKTWYGKFQDKVVVYPYSMFGYVNKVGGWDNQQLCKILAASRSISIWSIVLDAKTFFVKKCKNELLFDQNNKACTNLLKPVPVFQSAKEYVEKLYDIQLLDIIGPGGVPFFFHNETVRSMIEDTQKITGQLFIDFFQNNVCYPNLITEFYLYSAYVKYKYGKYDDLYSPKQRWTCVNIADWEVDNFTELFNNMQKFLTLTVSIASKSWAILPHEQQQQYLEFLHTKNLIQDTQITQNKLNTVINQ